MKLLYLREANLRDQFFIKDLVSHFAFSDKVLLVHDAFGERVEDTRFVTKRLSALFSEGMVYNNAFTADQRDFFSYEGDQLQVNVALIQQLITPIQLLILGPVIRVQDHLQHLSPLKMVQALRHQLEIEEVVLFATHSKSPMVAEARAVERSQEVDELLRLYEEEADVLEATRTLAPVTLASPLTLAS